MPKITLFPGDIGRLCSVKHPHTWLGKVRERFPTLGHKQPNGWRVFSEREVIVASVIRELGEKHGMQAAANDAADLLLGMSDAELNSEIDAGRNCLCLVGNSCFPQLFPMGVARDYLSRCRDRLMRRGIKVATIDLAVMRDNIHLYVYRQKREGPRRRGKARSEGTKTK